MRFRRIRFAYLGRNLPNTESETLSVSLIFVDIFSANICLSFHRILPKIASTNRQLPSQWFIFLLIFFLFCPPFHVHTCIPLHSASNNRKILNHVNNCFLKWLKWHKSHQEVVAFLIFKGAGGGLDSISREKRDSSAESCSRLSLY